MAKKKDKMIINGPQNIIQKTKGQETRTLRQIEGELRYLEGDNCVPAPHDILSCFFLTTQTSSDRNIVLDASI